MSDGRSSIRAAATAATASSASRRSAGARLAGSLGARAAAAARHARTRENEDERSQDARTRKDELPGDHGVTHTLVAADWPAARVDDARAHEGKSRDRNRVGYVACAVIVMGMPFFGRSVMAGFISM